MEELEVVITEVPLEYQWMHFDIPGYLGDQGECFGDEEGLAYIEEHGRLPEVCENCRKILIFWRGVTNKLWALLKLSRAHDYSVHGKYNCEIVIIYAWGEEYFKILYKRIKDRIHRNSIIAGVDWRLACKRFQYARPELFKSVKELSYR